VALATNLERCKKVELIPENARARQSLETICSAIIAVSFVQNIVTKTDD